MWMLDVKVYERPNSTYNYIEFYDVLEALVKRTVYRPQTLDDIYNNPSKYKLREGLQSLWDEKSQLGFESQPALQKVENLRRYYEKKRAKIVSAGYTRRKILLPYLVWVTLKLTRVLKKQVKARKRNGKIGVVQPAPNVCADSSMITRNNVSCEKPDNTSVIVVASGGTVKKKDTNVEKEKDKEKETARETEKEKEKEREREKEKENEKEKEPQEQKEEKGSVSPASLEHEGEEDDNESTRKFLAKQQFHSEGVAMQPKATKDSGLDSSLAAEKNAQEPNDTGGAGLSTFAKQLSGGKRLHLI